MMPKRSLIPLLLLSLLGGASLLPAADITDTQCRWRLRASGAGPAGYSQGDIEQEVEFGREVAARILGRHPLHTDKSIQRYVSRVGALLARNSSRPELTFRFAVIDSNIVNAYSTPGGYVFVTTAALRQMKNEAELAGVLAHEIAHVCERHIVRDLDIRGKDTSGISSIAALIGGASDAARVAFAQAVDRAVEILFSEGYSRNDERQADEDAVYFTLMAGYDPSGLITLFQRVSETRPAVGKSYPAYDERSGLLRKTIDEQGALPAGLRVGSERFAMAMKTL
ncbi:MAG: hypothetical protein Fur0034_21510 [Desulfuromonadia bacterium]